MVMLFGLILLINVASAVDVGIGDDEIGIDLSTQSVPNVSNYNVTGAEIWVTDEGDLDDVADISHSWLDDLAWSVAGHTIDDDIDMNDHTLSDISYMVLSGGGYLGDFDGDLDIASHLTPYSSLYYDLGSGLLRWRKLYVQNISAEFIDAYDIVISGDLNASRMNVNIFNSNIINSSFFNWTSGDDWNLFDGATLEFNISKLSTIYYNATQATAVEGTVDGGTLADTQHKDGNYDGKTFNFSETAGSPGLDMRINFTDVPAFTSGVMRYKTSSLAGDYPIVQLWSYDDLDWHDFPAVIESESFATMTQGVFDNVEHLQDGVVQMRLYKASNGNTNNHYYIDWVSISKGYGTPAGEEIDPYSWHRNSEGESGDYKTTGNVTATNITADYFYGDGSGLTGITSTVAIQLKNNSLASGNTYLLTNTTWNSINSQINNIKVTTECESMNLSICTDSGCTSEDVLYSESYKNASTYGSYTYMNADGKAGVYMKYFCNSGADTSNIYLGGLTA